MTEKFFKVHCNNCGIETRHEQVHQEDTTWYENTEEYRIDGSDVYELLKCCGCESVKLRHASWFNGEHQYTAIYPPKTFRKTPRWLIDLEFTLWNNPIPGLLREIYTAIQNNLPFLATMGIRSLLERIMIDKVDDQGTFSKTLDAFTAGGFLSRIQKEQVDAVIETGHAATHRQYKPSKEDIIALMDIVETIVQSIYLHPASVKELKNRVPPRPSRKKDA